VCAVELLAATASKSAHKFVVAVQWRIHTVTLQTHCSRSHTRRSRSSVKHAFKESQRPSTSLSIAERKTTLPFLRQCLPAQSDITASPILEGLELYPKPAVDLRLRLVVQSATQRKEARRILSGSEDSCAKHMSSSAMPIASTKEHSSKRGPLLAHLLLKYALEV
jgi:hypothetical protein